MNNRKKTNRGKKRRGTRKYSGYKRSKKKIRGKNRRRDSVVKIHSVSDTDFVMSTAFAVYRIPRSYFNNPAFHTATQQQLQKVKCFRSHLGAVDFLSFYWLELADVFDEDNFEKFKVADQ